VPASPDRTDRSLNLTTGGITLLGVLLSIGIVKVGSKARRGPLARLAGWIIGSGDDAG